MEGLGPCLANRGMLINCVDRGKENSCHSEDWLRGVGHCGEPDLVTHMDVRDWVTDWHLMVRAFQAFISCSLCHSWIIFLVTSSKRGLFSIHLLLKEIGRHSARDWADEGGEGCTESPVVLFFSLVGNR